MNKDFSRTLSKFADEEAKVKKTSGIPLEETSPQNNFDIKQYVDEKIVEITESYNDKFLDIDNSLKFIIDHLEKKNDICFEDAINGGCGPDISSSTLEYNGVIGGKLCNNYCKEDTNGPKIDKMKYTSKKIHLQDESVKAEYKKSIDFAMSGLKSIGIPNKAISGLKFLLKSEIFLKKSIEAKKTQSTLKVKETAYSKVGSSAKETKKLRKQGKQGKQGKKFKLGKSGKRVKSASTNSSNSSNNELIMY